MQLNQLISLCFFLSSHILCSQSTLLLEDYIKDRYEDVPIEGVKLIDFGNTQYMVSMSMTSVSTRKSISSLNRVCMIKARREALKFVEGSSITSETILNTSEVVTDRGVEFYEEFFDSIKENSSGWVDGMSVLTSWYFNNKKDYALVIYTEL